MRDFALNVDGKVTTLVIVRVTTLPPWEKAELSFLELSSANSDNQVLTILRSIKETRVTWTYGKKAVDSANDGTETAEEPTKLLTVSMPIAMFKWAITQYGLSVSKFVKDFNIGLLAVNYFVV